MGVRFISRDNLVFQQSQEAMFSNVPPCSSHSRGKHIVHLVNVYRILENYNMGMEDSRDAGEHLQSSHTSNSVHQYSTLIKDHFSAATYVSPSIFVCYDKVGKFVLAEAFFG